MDQTDREKLRRFANDIRTKDAVYRVLLAAFLDEDKEADVYKLAASRLAITKLLKAWKDIDRFKEADVEKPEQTATHV